MDIKIMHDHAFKLVFGRNDSKKLLSDFLERIIGKEIKIKEIVNGEVVSDIFGGKCVSLDLVSITSDGALILIEVQNAYEVDIEKRVKFYADRISSTILEKGENYRKIMNVISITILNHKFYKEKKHTYKHKFRLLNTEDNETFDANPLEIILFDKLEKEDYDIDDSVGRVFMYLFGLLSDDELEKLMNKDGLIRDIEERRVMISKSKKAEIYKLELEKREMIERNRIADAKKEGKREGIKKGRLEEKISFALKLKAKDFSLEDISDVTGLPLEKLKNLTSNT